MLDTGISSEFEALDLNNVVPRNNEQKDYIEKLIAVVMRRNPWVLVVTGQKGNGKSFLAQVAVNTFDKYKFKGGLYTTQPILQSELRSDRTYSGDIFDKYAYAPLLVLDEISDRPNDWTETVKVAVENILIERHRLHKPTVLIGNVDKRRIADMFDVRVKDRLKEGLYKVMNEESMRERHGNH